MGSNRVSSLLTRIRSADKLLALRIYSGRLRYLAWFLIYRPFIKIKFAPGVILFGWVELANAGHGAHVALGASSMVDHGSWALSPGARITIGSRTSINHGSFVVAVSSITIGNDCLIGEYVTIRDADHRHDDPQRPIKQQGLVAQPVVIADNVWIGRGVAILKGVHIGEGAIVGANAVVTRDVPPYAIVAGVPARQLRSRLPAEPSKDEGAL